MKRPYELPLVERVKYREDIFKPVFLEMVQKAPVKDINTDDMLVFCRDCVNNPKLSKISLKIGGYENSGMFVDEELSIIYKVNILSERKVMEKLTSSNEHVFSKLDVMNEWYYSIVSNFHQISPDPLNLYICKTGTQIVFIMSFRKHIPIPLSSDSDQLPRLGSFMLVNPDPEWDGITTLEKEIPSLEVRMKSMNIVHMDTHFGNIVYDQERKKILLIDWASCREGDASTPELSEITNTGIFKWYEDRKRGSDMEEVD